MHTFPAVLVAGPGRTAKTTLRRGEFSASHRHVSAERPDVRDVPATTLRLLDALESLLTDVAAGPRHYSSGAYARIPRIGCPSTSARRKSRPPKR